ncbi:MAG: hypothetical protein QXO75_09820, partial [Nitrososphaerota archaeon]
ILYFFIVSYVVRKPDRKSIKNQIVSVLVLLAFTSGIFFVFFGEIYAYYSGGFTAVTSNTSNSLENTLYYWLTLNSHGFIYSLLNTGYTLGEQSAPVFGWKWFSYYTSFPFFIIINAGWPVLAFLSIIFIKKIKQYDDAYRYYISFLTLSIIGIILQTGTALPTGPLYTWLFFHFPPIRVFDTLNLWYSPILYLSYGVLSVFSISCVFSSLETKLKSNSSNRNFRRALKASARYLWIFLVILWLLSPSYPLFGGAAVPNGTVSAQVELPNYEIATVYFLNSQNGSFRVISLPLFAYDSEENYPTGGYFGTNPLYLQLRPGISYIGSTGSMSSEELSSVNALLRALYSNSTQVVSILLSQLGIRYIVVTGDYSTDVTGIIGPFSLTKTMRSLNSTMGVNLVEHFDSYYIYKVSDSNLIEADKPVFFNENNIYGEIYHFNSSSSALNYNRITNISYVSNHGSNYSNVLTNNNNMTLYFNYSKNITWPYLLVNLQLDPDISTTLYNHILINATMFYNATMSFQVVNQTGVRSFVQSQAYKKGSLTHYSLDISGIVGNISGLTIFLYPNNQSNGTKAESIVSNITPYFTLAQNNWYDYFLRNPTGTRGTAVILNSSTFNDSSGGDYSITSIRYINPALQQLDVAVKTNSTFIIVLKDSYSVNWELQLNGTIIKEHVLVNGFMNGWLVSLPPGKYNLRLKYVTQSKFYRQEFVSYISVSLYIVIWIFIILIKRERFLNVHRKEAMAK